MRGKLPPPPGHDIGDFGLNGDLVEQLNRTSSQNYTINSNMVV